MSQESGKKIRKKNISGVSTETKMPPPVSSVFQSSDLLLMAAVKERNCKEVHKIEGQYVQISGGIFEPLWPRIPMLSFLSYPIFSSLTPAEFQHFLPNEKKISD